MSDTPGSRLAEQFAAAWEEGRLTSVEQFFIDHPAACADPEVAVRLIYEEFCLRQEAGEEADPEDVLRRFPQWRSKLEIVLDFHRLVTSRKDAPAFPSVGESFGGFRLVAELGRGAEGRVFLATQPLLSDRPVVVKIIPCQGNEHLSLARLQHTSIVPLYFAQDDVERNLRLLCMPYVGGISLARLLEMFADVPIKQRTGQHFADALQKARAAAPVAMLFEGPALKFLPCASYVQAACWIGACLADALQHAHGRGLAHLDLKPSNVLLAGDGQPMLLDFHLAREMLPIDRVAFDWLGGTPGYMSPEQESAIAAVREGRPVSAAVDGRSDVYSLGLLLYELLDGPLPIAPVSSWVPSLDELDSSIPPRVLGIVRKCLLRDPKDRYAEAELLAADLRHCLIDAPSQNRTKRTPVGDEDSRGHRLGRSVIAAVLLAAVIVSGFAASNYFGSKDEGRGEPFTNHGESAEQSSAQRRRYADELNEFVDRLRFLDSPESLPADRLRTLEAGCREIWSQRIRVMNQPDAPYASAIEQRIRTDLLDLAILWADLHVHAAPRDQFGQSRRKALQILTQAEAELGSSVVLSRERQVYAEALGLVDEAHRAWNAAAQLEPRTAWEHYAVGRSLLRAGQQESAAVQFQQAVDLDPQSFWPNFYRGICAYRLQQHETALAAFSACVALAPEKAECYFNRALVYRALGREDLAASDFKSARRLDPSFDAAPHGQ